MRAGPHRGRKGGVLAAGNGLKSLGVEHGIVEALGALFFAGMAAVLFKVARMKVS